ncbi:phospholipase D-like domain-containing protein [Salinibaculum rarum]|uniref:phospholipase D-like domain-containing protein n=1 Tax=Salinibaculum rarum TaxID=3058903 RepID=UPI00265DF9B5|nr:phospholipase D-like domain-containing protein [Salinibaculum sp. KK48]
MSGLDPVRLVLACSVAAALLVVGTLPVAGADGPVASVADEQSSTGPRLVAAYPNPVIDGDAGEYVVVSVPPATDLGSYSLADDDSAVSLPNRTASGRVVLSTAPNATASLVDADPLPVSDHLELANGGESLTLSHNGTVVDRLNYTDAPSGELRVVAGTRRWRPLGATDRPVVTGDSGTVTAFALPDAPAVATETLAGADSRILLAGYTLGDDAVADELLAAAARNVTVRVLVDGDPVGGTARRQARLLDRLADAGIEVRVLGGERARYNFHHAKYAVVDDRALVATENWKHAGLGGNGSRGWGVVTSQPRIVQGLAATFRADAGWHDARPWTAYRADESFQEAPPANETYPTRFQPRSVRVEETRLLVAPDNAETTVLNLIDNATETLAIQQVSIGGRGQPFVQAALAAARRGVTVRILLSSAWYVEDENRKLVDWLDERASRENLPLEARLAKPRGQFEKVHTKGLIVDGDQVVFGSMNWNNNSAHENREVVLVLEGKEAGTYYGRVFDADWPVAPPLSLGVVAAVLAVTLVACRAGSRLEFNSH